MSGQGQAPIIIKRKKVVGGHGHHGGAWKVAYADFVTAMMAFFLLMWLLGATTEKQRKSIADFFNPTIPVMKASGGGSGAFGGESIFTRNVNARQGTGAALIRPSEENKAKGSTGSEPDEEDAKQSAEPGQAQREEELEEIQAALLGIGGESMLNELLRRHIVTRLSDEGLVIELFNTENEPLLDGNGGPTKILRDLLRAIVPILELVDNDIAAQAHTRALPIVVRDNQTWPQTAQQAELLRTSLESAGLASERMDRVTGYADRRPVTTNPMDPRNDRLEIVVLRRTE